MIEIRRKNPKILTSIIILNIMVYIITSFGNFFIESSGYWINIFGFIPALIGDYKNIYRILTSMFVHADIFHILFNMYYLYLFGRPIIEVLGGSRFLILYLFSGIMASIYHTAFSYIGGLTSYVIPAIGASGAISGILGAYLLMYPGTHLILYSPYIIFPFPLRFRVKAEYYLLFWFTMQVLYGYMKIAGTVAVFAHAGGFLGGISILPLTIKHLEEYNEQRYVIPQFKLKRSRGIGNISKIILSILVLMLIIGNMYAILNPIKGELKSIIIDYSVDGRRYIDYTAIKLPDIDSYIRMISIDETRILLNRLNGMGILYNPLNKNSYLSIENRDMNIPVKIVIGTISRTYTVNVRVEQIHVFYDGDGFINHCEGTFSTQLLVIQGYLIYITDYMVKYNFIITSQTIKIEDISIISQFPSALISMIALIIILMKSNKLALTNEKSELTRPPIPL